MSFGAAARRRWDRLLSFVINQYVGMPSATVQGGCMLSNFSPLQIFNPYLDASLQKKGTFSALIVGLAGWGNQTRMTCVTGSGASCSAINYDNLMILSY
jgi:hypothetical protein